MNCALSSLVILRSMHTDHSFNFLWAIVIKLLIILTAFLHCVVAQQTNGSITVGASLTATPDNSQSWLSSSGDFAFGFQQRNNNFLLSIWYDKIPEKTIVWYPQGGPMVGRGSKVELTGGSGLVLTDPQGKEVWSSGSTSDLAYGVMNDTGNFVIFGSDSRKVWESFSFPADTILPTQVLPVGGVMNSTMSETNFSNGKFQLRLLEDGNLVINTVDLFSGSPGNAYYDSGTNDDSNSSNSGFQLVLDERHMYVERRNGHRSDLVSREKLPSGDYYYRATLDSDGLFTLYYYPKNPTGNTSWEAIWFVPENICETTGSGACGLNNVCSLDSNRPKCECPQGFSLLDPKNPKGDCKPIFSPSCDEGESNSGEDVFDFIELPNIDWPNSDYGHMNPSYEESCKSSCLEDCFCAVAIYRDDQCWKKQLPLANGKKDTSLNVTAYLKFRKVEENNGSITVGASLTATPNAQSWLSSSGDFAFGFQQIEGNDNFLLSIWYDKIPEKTIIWYPEGSPVVGRGSKVELTGGSGLVLSDPHGKEVWSSGSTSMLAYGFMNDTGNFVIVGSNLHKVWESFSFPTDTMLPTQVMARGGVMNSTMSKTNFSNGKFQLRLLRDGNLVLNTVDILSGSPGNAYYTSGTNDNSNSSNSGFQLIFDETGYMYVLRRNGERFYLVSRDRLPSGDYYYRATLDSDGMFTLYYYPKNPTGNTSWEAIWFVPENMCGVAGSGACGLNNVCSLESNRPKCECPQGFSLLDPKNPKGDCKPDFTLSCDEAESETGGDVFDFIELNNIDWPFSDYAHMDPSNKQSCKNSCLKDCFCAVAIYRDDQCWKKQLPLANGKKDLFQNVTAYLKFRKGDHAKENKNPRSLIFLGSVLLSTSVFVIIVLIVVICVGFFQFYKKNARKPVTSNTTAETNLPRFSYQELVKATNGFKDILGKGACGVVYAGKIGTRIVAVKKLEAVIKDGKKEFETEITAIARTHHKNLVQLLGYCDDVEHRLLIYEYMINGTLADFLFGDVKPCWKLRSQLAVGIAKGLTYLHEGCSTQIIHCDIKPQNILLDEYYNAKISDFGIAKLLMLNQSRTNTVIRGTKGYVAPEWFRNTPVTVKVDVYSFGVLLLEIISCRKSVVFGVHDEDLEVLTDLAWDCYQEGRLDVFVDDDLEVLDDNKKLTTFLMVGLWCVQEKPSLRPTMKKVIQMLEGEIHVTEPPCPCPFSVAYYTNH